MAIKSKVDKLQAMLNYLKAHPGAMSRSLPQHEKKRHRHYDGLRRHDHDADSQYGSTASKACRTAHARSDQDARPSDKEDTIAR